MIKGLSLLSQIYVPSPQPNLILKDKMMMTKVTMMEVAKMMMVMMDTTKIMMMIKPDKLLLPAALRQREALI